MRIVSEKIESMRAPEPVGLYPHARRVGNLLFLSGIGPRERGSDTIPGVIADEFGNVVRYDIEKQCHSVFNNVKQVVEDSGSNWENIVDVTVFLTSMKNDFEIYNRIYSEYFKDNQPCRTTVGVTRLPTPIAIELKVIATIDDEVIQDVKGPKANIPDRVSQDIDEIKALIQFFRRSPSSKKDCLNEVQRTRDIILFERTTEAPYRVTLANTFRIIINEINREPRSIQRDTNRSIIHQLDQLLNYIYANT